MAKRPRGKPEIVELGQVEMGPLGFPAKAIKLPLGKQRHAFLFTMTAKQRATMDQARFIQTAQSMGDMVHPARAVLVVLPDEAPDIRAYELKVI